MVERCVFIVVARSDRRRDDSRRFARDGMTRARATTTRRRRRRWREWGGGFLSSRPRARRAVVHGAVVEGAGDGDAANARGEFSRTSIATGAGRAHVVRAFPAVPRCYPRCREVANARSIGTDRASEDWFRTRDAMIREETRRNVDAVGARVRETMAMLAAMREDDAMRARSDSARTLLVGDPRVRAFFERGVAVARELEADGFDDF